MSFERKVVTVVVRAGKNKDKGGNATIGSGKFHQGLPSTVEVGVVANEVSSQVRWNPGIYHHKPNGYHMTMIQMVSCQDLSGRAGM
jgi:hypothetical protein